MSGLAEEVLTNIIADLIARAGQQLWGVTTHYVRNTWGSAEEVNLRAHVKKQLEDFDLTRILGTASLSGSEALIVETYLGSPEFETLIWNILSTNMTGGNADTYRVGDLIKSSLILHGLGPELAGDVALSLKKYFVDLLSPDSPLYFQRPASRQAEKVWNATERKTIEAGNNYALNRLVALLDTEAKTLQSLESVMTRLRSSVVATHNGLRPANIEPQHPVSLSDLYVAPALRRTIYLNEQIEQRINNKVVNIASVVQSSSRIVVLGDPGAGKSTLSEYASWSYAAEVRSMTGPVFVPLTLRRYGKQIRSTGGLSVIEAVHTACVQLYQVACTPVTVEYLCASGRLGVIFDGLDEILDAQDRQHAARSIVAFGTQFPRSRIIVTSRKVGYGVAPLGDDFAMFEILPFQDNQVEEYVKKWFRLAGHPEQGSEGLAENFLQDSDVNAADLRRNPLLLSLLCSLYRRRSTLPRNRPAVYEACAELMFDSWDRTRSLRPNFEFENHIDGAIQDIAWWLFTGEAGDFGASEAELVDRAAAYLSRWQFSDNSRARRAAREFVDFCKGRAWILSDTELTLNEIRFGFTHTTFLEYYAAKYICNSRDSESIIEFVVAHATDSRWQLVCLMALQIASSNVGFRDRAAQQLAHSVSPIREDSAFRSLCSGVLQSLALTPASVKLLAEISLQPVLDGAMAAKSFSVTTSKTLPVAGWMSGSQIASENHVAVSDFLISYLSQAEISTSRVRRLLPLFLDLLVTEGSQLSDLRTLMHRVPNKVFDDLSRATYGDAGTEISLLLCRKDVGATLMDATVFGNAGAEVFCPVKAPWGLRPYPNGIEVFLWALNDPALATTGWLASLANILRPLSFDKTNSRWRERSPGYRPSAVWPSIHGATSPNVTIDDEFLALGTRLAIALVEANEGAPSLRGLQYLARRPWGSLSFFGSMIARRHNFVSDVDHEDLARARDLGFESWYQTTK